MGMLVCSALCGVAAAQESEVSGVGGREIVKDLTGTWRAKEDRTPRSTLLDEQVFGRGAVDVRNVALVVSSSGDATLQVRKSVVSANGRVFAPSIIEVKMR